MGASVKNYCVGVRLVSEAYGKKGHGISAQQGS